MQKFITSIFSLLLLLSAVSINAESIRYNVEIVIFEDVSDRYLDSEQWPVVHQAEIELSSDSFPFESEPLLNNKPDSLTSDESSAAIVPKKAEYPEINGIINITHHVSNALADHVRKLKRSSRYSVLLYQSWQQTGLDSANAVSVKIDTSKIGGTENNNIKIPFVDQKTMDKSIKSSIQGDIKLVLGRYLHLHTDLRYKRINKSYQPDSLALNNKKFDEFDIKSQRKMRSNKLHYIDHPLLGILVIVSPVKPPEPTENSEALDKTKTMPVAKSVTTKIPKKSQ